VVTAGCDWGGEGWGEKGPPASANKNFNGKHQSGKRNLTLFALPLFDSPSLTLPTSSHLYTSTPNTDLLSRPPTRIPCTHVVFMYYASVE
jgi:hypothetical protein